MKDQMLKLLEGRKEKMRRDYAEGWITQKEYIAIKAELMALTVDVHLIKE